MPFGLFSLLFPTKVKAATAGMKYTTSSPCWLAYKDVGLPR